MTRLNVATLANNFFKVYYFEHKKDLLTGAAFFSIPVKADLVKNSLVLNIEDTKSLLLPQIARASDQIKFRDTVFTIPSAEVYTFVAKYQPGIGPEEVFNQAKANLKFNFDEAQILLKEAKGEEAQAYIVRKEYLQFVKDIFKSGTFDLKAIVPITEVLVNITSDVSGPHILISKVENEILVLLIAHNMAYQVSTIPVTEPKVPIKPIAPPPAETSPQPSEPVDEIITSDKATPKAEAPEEMSAKEVVESDTQLPNTLDKKVVDVVAKLQTKAKEFGFEANEIYLADKTTQAFQKSVASVGSSSSATVEPASEATGAVVTLSDLSAKEVRADNASTTEEPKSDDDSATADAKLTNNLTSAEGKISGSLQTSPNVIKIVQVPFDEGLDSTAFTMILPNETYSKKGVNFWYLGDNPPDTDGEKSKHMGKIIIVVLVILLLGGGGVWYFLQRQSTSVGTGSTEPTPTQSESPITVTVGQSSPTTSPTPSVTLERKNLKVQVYNGGGKTGEAARIKGILEGKGYVVVGTGNNPDGSSDTTKLQLKPTKKEYFNMLKEDLKTEYEVTTGTELQESSNTDAVLIIGTK